MTPRSVVGYYMGYIATIVSIWERIADDEKKLLAFLGLIMAFFIFLPAVFSENDRWDN